MQSVPLVGLPDNWKLHAPDDHDRVDAQHAERVVQNVVDAADFLSLTGH